MYGRPKSEYTLQRIKEANSKQILIEGKLYNSVTDASKELGLGVTTICYRLKAQSDTFKDWNYA